MKQEFCTYEQSVALRELGFDEICIGYFDNEDSLQMVKQNGKYNELVAIKNSFDSALSAPIIQQAFRFFRGKYKFTHEIKRIDNINDNEHKFIESYYCRVENFDFGFDIGEYNTYKESEQACLDKLIELAKESKQ